MRPRYPLESLRRVRQLEVDARERELASRAEKVRHSAQLRAAEEGSLAAEQACTERTLAEERDHLASGGARAADLARSHEFEHGARRREDERKQALAAARRVEHAAETAEREARAELARAQAKQSALGRHHERFELAQARAAEREAEDDALDLHRHGAREGRS